MLYAAIDRQPVTSKGWSDPRAQSVDPPILRFVLRGVLLVGVFFAAALLAVPRACAQGVPVGQDSTPSTRYYMIFGKLYDGDYRDAADGFEDETRGAIRIGQARWIDSICYETMLSETYYQMGYPEEALKRNENALTLLDALSDWMIRVKFPGQIMPMATTTTPCPWGTRTRRSTLGHFPSSMVIQGGRLNNNNIVQQGGVVAQAFMMPINVQEIVRASSIALKRRADLLGPLGKHDKLTQQLSGKFAQRPCPPNSWSQSWVDLQYGLALVAEGKTQQAMIPLRRAELVAGQFDHPMTSIALLELGKLAIQQGNFKQAALDCTEATYAAYYYLDIGILEEAFYHGTFAHMMLDNKTLYPPLLPAIEWARRKHDRRHLYISLLLDAAENYSVMGDTRSAIGALTEAERNMAMRRDMPTSRLGTRLKYLKAQLYYQVGQTDQGNTMLGGTLEQMRRQSNKRFQIAYADRMYTTGVITPRVATELFGEVLNDPTATDWLLDPMESMAVLLSPHEEVFEHWFNVTIAHPDHERAMEIADLTRRHRFFCSMPMGGRLLSLRWILEGDEQYLDQASRLSRRDLLTRWPKYAALSKQAAAVAQQLKAIPRVAGNQDSLRRQRELLEQLAEISGRQEAMLREMALRREPDTMAFPPVRRTVEVQKSLPPGHAALLFFGTKNYLHAFLMNNEQYSYWQLGLSPGNAQGAQLAAANQPMAYKTLVRKQVANVLREMGNFGPNTEVALSTLESDQWKKESATLLNLLLDGNNRKGVPADLSVKFDELVVVPDDVLWYLPFESLQVDVQGKMVPLIGRFRVRYAPTMSTAVGDPRGRHPEGSTGIVLGKLWPGDDQAVAQEAFQKMAGSVPGAVAVTDIPPAPSAYYASIFDRLIVLHDLADTDKVPYGWAPLPLGRSTVDNLLADWLRLPMPSPMDLILPGFHTEAESGLRRVDPQRPGQEIFLTVCGLMATGSRTLLLSRWRTGGGTAFDLIEEYAQELSRMTPAKAWQRSVYLCAGGRVDLEKEPRIKRAVVAQPPGAKHPFYWAGYMLVDAGESQPLPAGGIPVAPGVPGAPAAGAPAAGPGAAEGGNPMGGLPPIVPFEERFQQP